MPGGASKYALPSASTGTVPSTQRALVWSATPIRGTFGGGVVFGNTWITRNAAIFVSAGHVKSAS